PHLERLFRLRRQGGDEAPLELLGEGRTRHQTGPKAGLQLHGGRVLGAGTATEADGAAALPGCGRLHVGAASYHLAGATIAPAYRDQPARVSAPVRAVRPLEGAGVQISDAEVALTADVVAAWAQLRIATRLARRRVVGLAVLVGA